MGSRMTTESGGDKARRRSPTLKRRLAAAKLVITGRWIGTIRWMRLRGASLQEQVFPKSRAVKTEDTGRLLTALNEAAKQATSLFSIYLATTTYGIITMYQTDANAFFSRQPAFKLPLFDVQVPAHALLVALPIVVVPLGIYVQVLVGYLRHLQRVEQLTNSSLKQAIDGGMPFPVLPALARRPGLPGAVAGAMGGLADAAAWLMSPALAILCFCRSIVLRGSSNWILGYTGAMALLAAATAAFWSLGRREVAVRSGTRRPPRLRLTPWFLVAALIVSAATWWAWALRTEWPLQGVDRVLSRVEMRDWVFPMDVAIATAGPEYTCRQVSATKGVRSMALTNDALFFLGGSTSLMQLALKDMRPDANAAEVEIAKFTTKACANGTCGEWPAGGPMITNGKQIVFAISFEPAGPCAASCYWHPDPTANTTGARVAMESACGSVWRYDPGQPAPELVSGTEAYQSGLATDGTHVYWARSYPNCGVSGVRVALDAKNREATTLYPMRPNATAATTAEGGGLAVLNGQVYWLSSGVRSGDGHGGLLSTLHAEGILYAGPAFSNSNRASNVHPILTYLDRPGALITDGASLYFSTADGRIWRWSNSHVAVVYRRSAGEVVRPVALASSRQGRALVFADADGIHSVSLGEESHQVSRLSSALSGVNALAVSERADLFEPVVYVATVNGIYFCEAPKPSAP